jgi:hypothetical protein
MPAAKVFLRMVLRAARDGGACRRRDVVTGVTLTTGTRRPNHGLVAGRAALSGSTTIASLPLEHQGCNAPNVDLRYQSARLVQSHPGPPMTFGNAAAARVRLIVWCKSCGHQIEPDSAELASRHGAYVPARDWCERLAFSECGSRQADMVVTGDPAASSVP